MHRQINHKTMRLIVGIIAVLLAPITYLLAEVPLHSISASYWTDARDIFVGSLVAVGFFLCAYNGAGGRKDWEYYLSKASCVFAIAIALFPTTNTINDKLDSAWTKAIAELFSLTPDNIHLAASILLFTCLIAMMWYFSNRAQAKGKLNRSRTYRGIAIVMATGIILLSVMGATLEWNNTTLWVEIWALSFFGAGWLLAGAYKTDPTVEPLVTP